MDSTIKSLTITGSAAEDAMKPRRSGSRRKNQQRPTDQEDKNGDSELIENAKRLVFVKPTIHVPQAVAKSQMSLPPQPYRQVQPHVEAQADLKPQVQAQVLFPLEGGNVILKPPKQQRVKLQPKLASSVAPILVNQTRKARRIHLSNLTHRFTRAKRVCDETEKKPMDSIRTYLIQRGVIQSKSKAPEKMLRSMYSDFMLLKDQAL